jgi:hypoxanthine phosphoribosyltransferase
VKEWRWIIYPWAVTEDLAVLVQAMQLESTDTTLLQQQLFIHHGINVAVEQIEDALTLIRQSG